MHKEIKKHTEWEEKISQLLWEYMEEKKKNPEWFLEISTALMIVGGNVLDVYMISKQFWFIEWLVQNDKIDFEWMSWHWKIISYLTDKKGYKWNDVKEWVVLMLLSIQDEPVKFLSEILKDE